MMNVPQPLEFDWDEGNEEKNWIKHLVSRKEAEEVFYNRPVYIYSDDRHSLIEHRLLAYGVTNQKRLLAIVFVFRRGKVRVISARDQNSKERKKYENKKNC